MGHLQGSPGRIEMLSSDSLQCSDYFADDICLSIGDEPNNPVVDWSADGEDDRKRDAGYLTDSILSNRGRGGYRRGSRGGGMRGRGGLPPRGPGRYSRIDFVSTLRGISHPSIMYHHFSMNKLMRFF